MQKSRKKRLAQILTGCLVGLGVLLVVISIFYTSSFLAILGTSIIFWGAILVYITPTKHVPLALLNVATISPTTNIERILAEANLTEQGLYLPPRFIQDPESSIVFIPEHPGQPLPKLEDIEEEKLFPNRRNSVFITPPGLALSKLFEKEIKISFTKVDLNFVQQKLSKLLVKDMELVDTAELQIQNDIITIVLTGNVLNEICQETKKLTKTHKQVGCLLSSAIACVLAKASGKVITIYEDEQSPDGKTTRIKYKIIGE
jgi:hypothetical protein